MKTTVTITEEESEKRIDQVLATRFSDRSRSYFQYLIDKGFVTNRGSPLKKKESLKVGETLEIVFEELPLPSIDPEPMELDILYEDDYIAAINKPPGMVVHPGVGNPRGTLVNGLMAYLKELPSGEDTLRPGIIHRLDKETSGVILVAKQGKSLELMMDSFKERRVQKEYLAITEDVPRLSVIDAPIGRHKYRREEMAVVETGGKEAYTEIEILERSEQRETLVLARPRTGRTHQIRVHLKHAGARIVGDQHYGSRYARAPRTMLHAKAISFTHPILKKELTIEAPLPEDFSNLAKKLFLNPKMSRKISSFILP